MKSLATNTAQQYFRSLKRFDNFMKKYYNKSWKKATKKHISNYVVYLKKHKNLKVSTIRSHLSSITFHYQAKYDRDIISSFSVKKLLNYYAKDENCKKTRLPITKKILEKLIKNVKRSSTSRYYRFAFTAIYSLMHFLALRISEIADYSARFSHAIKLSDIKIGKNIKITIRTFKHSKNSVKYNINNATLKAILKKWLKLRGNSKGCLFIHKNLVPFSRSFVCRQLKKDIKEIGLNPQKYNTHSFRKGRATFLAQKGYSTEQIAMIGRWHTNAFKTYISPSSIKITK